MPLYNVNRERFEHDGERKTFGDTVEMTEQQATPYLARQALLQADESFTPTELGEGVVTVDASIPAADSGNTAGQLKESAGHDARPAGGESPTGGAKPRRSKK